jgi:thymidylate synthase ThyX
MELRSCNEDTGEIYHTRVRDVVFSGLKAVYRVKLKNGQTIVASKDHLFLTKDGWQSLEKAVGLSLSPGKIAAWERSAEFAVNGIEAYRDPTWLAGMRDAGLSVPRIAKYCGVSIHRVKYQCRRHGIKESDPQTVWLLSHTEAPWNKGRRYSNLTTRGKPGKGHVRKGAESHLWRGGTTPERKRIGAWTVGQAFRTHRRRLRKPFVPKKKRAMVRHFVELQSIEYAGERETYDLEVDGPYHNFVADGFIVHNSRNSASSRAVPTSKLIERVELDPVLPLEWGRNKAGMSASETLSTHEAADATQEWLRARDDAVRHAKALLDLKVHKQELNRILEPFLWHTVIVTSTEWKNFFELRCAPNAQPEIRRAALLMRAAMAESEPRAIGPDDWHTPLVQDDELELDVETRKRISAARCARVSYLTHEGKREIAKDLELYERLRSDRHLSPFEHVATPAGDNLFHANFRGWIQMRVEVERLGPVAAG